MVTNWNLFEQGSDVTKTVLQKHYSSRIFSWDIQDPNCFHTHKTLSAFFIVLTFAQMIKKKKKKQNFQCLGFLGGSEVKASASNAGDLGSVPGSGRSPGEGNDNPLQYSCLENPMDGGALQATIHGVAKSQTRLTSLSLFQCSAQLKTVAPNCASGYCILYSHILHYKHYHFYLRMP